MRKLDRYANLSKPLLFVTFILNKKNCFTLQNDVYSWHVENVSNESFETISGYNLMPNPQPDDFMQQVRGRLMTSA